MDEQAARDRIRRYQTRAAEGATRRFVILAEDATALGTCGSGRLQEDTPVIFYALLRRGRGRAERGEPVLMTRWLRRLDVR